MRPSAAVRPGGRDVPDQTRDELASRAALTGRSLQEYLRAHHAAALENPPCSSTTAGSLAAHFVPGGQARNLDVTSPEAFNSRRFVVGHAPCYQMAVKHRWLGALATGTLLGTRPVDLLASLRGGIATKCAQEVNLAERWPVNVTEVQLRSHALPQQEV
jgi:hypothetical protein